MLRNTRATYGSVAKVFHWVIFILVVCMLIFGYWMDGITDKTLRASLMNIHKLIGLTILLIMMLRLIWALLNPKPDLPNAKPWEHRLERIGHFLLYFVLLAMPIAGWVMAVTAGFAPHIFNFRFQLPLSKNENVMNIAMGTHNTLAIVIIVLVSLHILAALYHYFFKKDNVLQRMMPGN